MMFERELCALDFQLMVIENQSEGVTREHLEVLRSATPSLNSLRQKYAQKKGKKNLVDAQPRLTTQTTQQV